MGAPLRLDDAMVAKLAELAALPISRASIAAAAGISTATLWEWLKRGKLEPDTIFGALVKAMAAANAKAEQDMADSIIGAAKAGDWKAATFVLTRRFPATWALPNERMPTSPHGKRQQSDDLTTDEAIEAGANYVEQVELGGARAKLTGGAGQGGAGADVPGSAAPVADQPGADEGGVQT